MATVKKGTLTRAHEWWVHLRPYGKRRFWHRERGAAKQDAWSYEDQYDSPRAIEAMADVDDYYERERELRRAKQSDDQK